MKREREKRKCVCVRMKSFSIYRVPAVARSTVIEKKKFIASLLLFVVVFNFLTLFPLSFPLHFVLDCWLFIVILCISVWSNTLKSSLGGHIFCSIQVLYFFSFTTTLMWMQQFNLPNIPQKHAFTPVMFSVLLKWGGKVPFLIWPVLVQYTFVFVLMFLG